MVRIFVEIDSKFNLLNNIYSLIYVKDNKILFPKNFLKHSAKKKQKSLIKLDLLMKENNIDEIILEKKLKEVIGFKYKKENLIKYIPQIIKYIIEKQKLDKNVSIGIMVNALNLEIKNIIKELSIIYKHLVIVTEKIQSGLKMQDEIFNNCGIMLKVSNNRNKALKDIKLIINVDFNSELLNEYTILDTATVMNIKEKNEIKSKRFCGLNLNGIVFELNNKEKKRLFEEYNIDYNKYDAEDFNISEINIVKIFSKNGKI